MTTRRKVIKESELNELIEKINVRTNSPLKPYSGAGVSNVGNYHLDMAYGGYNLVQMANTGGGVTCPLGGGYYTKRELYNKLQVYLSQIG